VGNSAQDTEDYLAVGASIDKQIQEQVNVCRYVASVKRSKKKVNLSFDEWNVWYRARDGEFADGKGKIAPPLLEEVYNLEDVLVIAQFLNSFIRHADTVKIANIAQIVNVIAPILTRGDEMLIQSIFYPIAMFAERRDGTSLRVATEGPVVNSKSYGTVAMVDSSAILNGNSLSVFAVNRNPNESVELAIQPGAGQIVSVRNADIVNGTDPNAANSYENPNVVTRQPFDQFTVANGTATTVLPPLSVVAVTFEFAP